METTISLGGNWSQRYGGWSSPQQQAAAPSPWQSDRVELSDEAREESTWGSAGFTRVDRLSADLASEVLAGIYSITDPMRDMATSVAHQTLTKGLEDRVRTYPSSAANLCPAIKADVSYQVHQKLDGH